MPVNLAEVEHLQNKRVTIQYSVQPEDGERTLKEQDGTLMAAQPGIGIMFRPKGSNQGILVDEADLEEIVPVPTAPKKVKPKSLKQVGLADIRVHLAERHGTPLSWIHSVTLEQALEFHNTVDHSDLGHQHTRGEGTTENSGESEEATEE